MDLMFAAEQMAAQAQAQAAALYYMNQAVNQGVAPTGAPQPGFGLMPTPVMTQMGGAPGAPQPFMPGVIPVSSPMVSAAGAPNPFNAIAGGPMGMPLALAPGQTQSMAAAAMLPMAEKEVDNSRR